MFLLETRSKYQKPVKNIANFSLRTVGCCNGCKDKSVAKHPKCDQVTIDMCVCAAVITPKIGCK